MTRAISQLPMASVSRPSVVKGPNPFIDVPQHAIVVARLFIFAFYFAVIVGANFGDTNAISTAYRILAVGGYLFISCYPLMFRTQGIGILHPLYFLCAYGFVKGTLPDYAGLAFGVSAHPALPMLGEAEVSMLQVRILALQSLGWLMVYAGFRFTNGIKWKFLRIRPRPKLIIWGAVGTYAVGCWAFYMLSRLSGGLAGHMKNIARGFGAKVYELDPEFASAYAFLVTLVMIAPAVLLLRDYRATRRPFFWLLAAGAILLLFLVNGRRSALLRPVLLFVTCWLHGIKRLPIGRLGLVALGLFIVVGAVGEFRRSNWSSSRKVSFEFMQELTLTDAFQMSLGEVESRRSGGPLYPIVYRVPSSIDFQYGLNYVEYIYRFIPRVLWPRKPRGIGVDCGRIFYGVRYAVPPGPYGEAYWSGGILGVVVVFFLWGVLLKSVYTFYLRFNALPIGCLLYLMTLSLLTPDETGFRSWIFLFAPTVAVLTISGVLKFNWRR